MNPERIPPHKRHYGPRISVKERAPLDEHLRFWLPGVIAGGVGLVWVAWVKLPIWIVPPMALFAILVVRLVTGGAVWLVGEGALGTSGGSTPYERGFSKAEAMAMQGEYVKAITAYQVAIAEAPEDPEPYLRVARLYKNDLGELDDAAFWFRRVRRDAQVSAGQDLAASRELIELYLASDDPRRAIPELARVIERFADTPEREWAEGLLRNLKSQDDPN